SDREYFGVSEYLLCGWHISSEIVLPELLPWSGNSGEANIVVRVGSVPNGLEGATAAGPLIQVSADRTCLLEVPPIARFLVSGGTTIVVQPAESVDEAAIRAFLLGTAFGMLCHQRGLFPLHASSVRIGQECIALAGMSGVGKSTLAAAMVKSGATLVADD